MRALWRAAAADLRGRRLQTTLFALVVVVATAGMTAGLGQQRSAAERWDEAFARANGAHVAFYGRPAALRRVQEDREVVQSSAPTPVTFGTLHHDGAQIDDVEVRAAGARRAAVGTPLLFAGRWLTGDDPDEVVIERSLALEEGIEPGDRVRLQGDGGGVELTVVGTALNLVDCFYPECESQTAWTTAGTGERLAGRGAPPRSLLLVRIARPDAVEAFAARVQDALGTGLDDLEQFEETRGNALLLNRFLGAFLAAFGVFLLVASGLVVLSTVSARVLARYRELGILKAIGVTPRALALLVLGENLAIATAGAAVGVVVGGWLAPSLQLRFSEVLEPGRATFPPDVLVGATVVVLGIVAAATLLPAVRAGRVPASQAIVRGAAPVSLRPSRLAALAARLRLGAPVAVGLKDAGARPLRTWLTIAGLAVTVIAVVATLAFDRTVQQIVDDPALTGDPQAIEVDPGDAEPAQVAGALDRQSGVDAWFTATERQVAVGSQRFQVRALGGDVERSGFVIHEGRMLAKPGEAVVGFALQDQLGRGVGDRIQMEVAGSRLDLRIVGRFATGEDEGERAMITLDDLRRVEPGADPERVLVRVSPDADRAAVARSIDAAAPGVKADVVETDLGVMDAFRAAFYMISLLVLAVGLVNLGGTAVLGIHERLHDLAILKAMGFTPRQVALSVATGTGAVAAAAVAVGVPAGIVVADAMLAGVGRGAGVGPELGASPPAGGVAAACLGIIALAAGLGALVARRAARAPVAEALRAE